MQTIKTQAAQDAFKAHAHEAFSHCDTDAMAREFIALVRKECPEEVAATPVFPFEGCIDLMTGVLRRWLTHFDEVRYHRLAEDVRCAGLTDGEIDELLFEMIEEHPRGQAFAVAIENAARAVCAA